MKLTATDIVRAINNLPRNNVYHYPTTSTKTVIEIADVVLPEGPIHVRRYDPEKGESGSSAKLESISSQMIWRGN